MTSPGSKNIIIPSERILDFTFKNKNEIHLLSYSEDANRIDVEHVFKVEKIDGSKETMSPEVTQISSSPYNRNMLVVAAQNDTDSNAILFYQLASSLESGEVN